MNMESFEKLRLLEAIWWLGFLTALGLCIGSFLNAIIHRLPRGISIRKPFWSFCPLCDARIRWYDNLPLLSFRMLRGRCRRCGAPISVRYPIVETLAALIVLLIFDAMFVARTHQGLIDVPGLSWRLTTDWPIFLAHVVLFASLWSMSALDIENYWVDIRFTTFAVIFGIAMHMAWTPPSSDTWIRPSATTGAICVVMPVVGWLTVWILNRALAVEEPPVQPEGSTPLTSAHNNDAVTQVSVATGGGDADPNAHIPSPGEPAAAGDEALASEPVPSARNIARAHLAGLMVANLVGLALLAVIGLTLYALTRGGGQPPLWLRWGPALLILFALIVSGLARVRTSDEEIHEAIESERVSARRFAALELVILLPAVIGGVIAAWLLIGQPERQTMVTGWMHWSPTEDWRPLLGLATALTGYTIGCGIGWLVRILATLVMGKEAFGTGDIHMMGAAGCVAGWPVVLIGFVLCSFLALFGWLLTIPFKRGSVIALGPWLTLGFLIVVLFYEPLLSTQMVENVVIVVRSLL